MLLIVTYLEDSFLAYRCERFDLRGKVFKQSGGTYAVALADVLQQDGVLQGRQVIALHLLLFGQDKKFRDSARIHIALAVLFQMPFSAYS